MTIPHADLIRAVLDGKTVQWRNVNDDMDWADFDSVQEAVLGLTYNSDDEAFRLKPEPRCVWTEHWGSWRDEVRNYSPRATVGRTILRHEFDPDTGEYLRTVKEDA